MRVVVIGGHLSPALSVIEALPKGYEVLFIGRKYIFEGDKTLSLEYQTVNSLGIAFASLSTGRLQRKFTKHTIPSLFKLPGGCLEAVSILHRFKPDVVLGFGGYLEIPVVLAAYILRIPAVIHEQTQEAGLANKICSHFAKKICISWEISRKFFPEYKTVLTGNPIHEFKVQNSKFKIQENELPLIYITGGSSGSHSINVLAEGCIKQLLKHFKIIHQTGDAKEFNDFKRLSSLREKFSQEEKEKYIIKKFISPSDVLEVLKTADLIIGRAGINTVTELLYAGKPCVLIPLPFSQNKEQLKNAKLLKKVGLAEILEQKSATSDKLLRLIKKITENLENYKKKGKLARALVDVNAADKIIKVLEDEKKNL